MSEGNDKDGAHQGICGGILRRSTSENYSCLGSVNIVTPPSMRALAFGAIVLLMTAALVLLLTPYDERLKAGGMLLPDSGLIILSARTAGRVSSLPHGLSSTVVSDEVIAELDADDESRHNGLTGTALLGSLEHERKAIENGVRLGWDEARQKAQSADELKAAQLNLLSSIQTQIELQTEQVESYAAVERRSAPLVQNGYVTRTEYDQQRVATVGARIRLADLRKEKTTAQKQLASIASDLRDAEMTASRFEAQSRQAMEKVAQQIVSSAANASQVYRSPVNGAVASMAVKVGQLRLNLQVQHPLTSRVSACPGITTI
jgi:membrane fusion protein